MRLKQVQELPKKRTGSRYDKLLDEFLVSDMSCAEVMEEAPVGNTIAGINGRAVRRGLDVKAIQRDNRAYLVKLIPGTNLPVVGDVS